MAIGKTAPNGTLNADGAFYSVQDVNVLLENAGGGGGGGADLPTPTVADAGSVVVVDNEGKYALGEAGGGGSDNLFIVTITEDGDDLTADKTFTEIENALARKKIIIYSFFDMAAIANFSTIDEDNEDALLSLGATFVGINASGDNPVLIATEIVIGNDNTVVINDYTSI